MYANYYLLAEMCAASLAPLPPDEEEAIARIDSDDEVAVRKVIRAYIVPNFHMFTEDSQQKCKQSLSYFLTTGDAPFFRSFAELALADSPLRERDLALTDPFANLPEFPLAVDDPMQFFKWLWDELFPGEDYHVQTEGWTVDNRWETAGLYWKKPG